MSLEILYSDLPTNVQDNFQEFCGWPDNGTSFEYCQETEKNEFAKFKATINNSNDRITFHSEAHYTWFIIRWS